MKFKSKSILLRKFSYGEADFIVSFFSKEYGKLRGIAKSARVSKRRFSNSLQIGARLEISFTKSMSSNLVRLDEVEPIFIEGARKADLENLIYMMRCVELAELFLPEGEKNHNKYNLLESTMDAINKGEFEIGEMIAFELDWLEICGYKPWLASCVLCNSSVEKDRFFSLDKGGLVCRSCAISNEGMQVVDMELDILRTVQHSKISSRVAKEKYFDVERKIALYCERVLGKSLNTRMCYD